MRQRSGLAHGTCGSARRSRRQRASRVRGGRAGRALRRPLRRRPGLPTRHRARGRGAPWLPSSTGGAREPMTLATSGVAGYTMTYVATPAVFGAGRTQLMLFRLLFDWFFWSYALAGGAAVAVLLAAVGAMAGRAVPGVTVLVTGAAAAGVFRLALLAYRRDPARPGPVDYLGRFVAAAAFAFLAATGALGVAALGWLLAARFGTNAEAGWLVAGTAAGGSGIGFVATAATTMLASVLLVLHGYRRGRGDLRVREHAVVLRGLAHGSEGIRLVHLSDLH